MSVLSPAVRIREIAFGSAATAPAGSRAVTPVSLVIAPGGGGHFDPKPFGGHSKLHGLDDPGGRDTQPLTPQFFVVHAFSSAFSYSPSLPRTTTRFPGRTGNQDHQRRHAGAVPQIVAATTAAAMAVKF